MKQFKTGIFTYLEMNKGKVLRIVISAILILVFVVVQIISLRFTMPINQKLLSRRWSMEQSYEQISVFLSERTPMTEDETETIQQQIENAYTTMQEIDDDTEWMVYAYSMDTQLTVNSDTAETKATFTAVRENYFQFQSMKLVNGTYFWKQDTNDDLILIDESLAWALFGASSVSGLIVYINGTPFMISGVIESGESTEEKYAYGENPRGYMSYSAYLRLQSSYGGESDSAEVQNSSETKAAIETGTEGEKSSNVKGFTVCQFLLPEPVKHYAHQVIEDIFRKSDKVYNIVEHGDRFSINNLTDVLGNYGKRSVNQQGIYFPFWENAVRMTEDYVALLTLLGILALIYPVLSLIVFMIKRWQSRTWHIKNTVLFFVDKIKYRSKETEKE